MQKNYTEKVLKSETWTLIDEVTLNYVFLSTSYAELKSTYEELLRLSKSKSLKQYDMRLMKFYDLQHKTITLIRRLWLLIGENVKDKKNQKVWEAIENFVWKNHDYSPQKAMKEIDSIMRKLTKLLTNKKLVNISSTIGKFRTSKKDMAIS
ncbi:hypothetical protein J7M00_03930 [bacterium]|nr:hypothetical protein [bacterium]